MQTSVGLCGLLLVATVLAGCTGGSGADSADGFRIDAPDDPTTEPFVFTAAVKGESHTWDFGDGREAKTGKSVEHVYGISDGTVKVVLKVATADGTDRYERTVTIGSGENEKPGFTLEVGTAWAVTGEDVRFRAGGEDAEGDPLLFSWHCIRKADLQKVGEGHVHAGDDGVPFASDTPSRIPASVAEEPLPEADRRIDGHFCDNARGDGTYSEDTVVEGSFDSPGFYRIMLLAKDPATSSVSGYFDMVVSDPADRPGPTFEHTFGDTFLAGADGTGQTVGGSADPDRTFDQTSHSFRLEVPATILFVNVSYDDMGGVNAVHTDLYKGNSVLSGGDGDLVVDDPERLAMGDYRLELTLERGAQVEYTVEVSGLYDLDPFKVFEPPH